MWFCMSFFSPLFCLHRLCCDIVWLFFVLFCFFVRAFCCFFLFQQTFLLNAPRLFVIIWFSISAVWLWLLVSVCSFVWSFANEWFSSWKNATFQSTKNEPKHSNKKQIHIMHTQWRAFANYILVLKVFLSLYCSCICNKKRLYFFLFRFKHGNSVFFSFGFVTHL